MDPSIRLNATFAPLPVEHGGLALASQSGALGVAVLSSARSRGLGVAQFVSMGNKADVSGNDLILAWHSDPNVRVIALYLESVGNARKFARICRRVSRDKPIIVIKAGRTDAGRRAGLSHTAAAAASDRVMDALFEQAGVIRVDTIEEMLDAAAVLSSRQRLGGPRIAIVGNSGGPEILAADAATSAGLTVEMTPPALAAAVRRFAPNAPSVDNPTDLGAGVQPKDAGRVVHTLVESPDVDAVLGVFCRTLVASDEDMVNAVLAVSTTSSKPILLCQIGSEQVLSGIDRRPDVPVFSFPEPAAKALGAAWRWKQISSAPVVYPELPERADLAGAQRIVNRCLESGERWLTPDEVAELLDSFGINRSPQEVVRTLPDALVAAEALGLPVVMKGGSAGAHKSAIGAVRIGVRTLLDVGTAFTELMGIEGTTEVLIQPTAAAGVELIVGAVSDPQFGPIVMVGAGGASAGLTNDEVFRLAPISVEEAAEALNASPSLVSLMHGWRGMPPVSRLAVADLIARVGALVDEVPEIAELDLNPVICRGLDLIAVDARIRLTVAPERQDPTVRRLRPVT
jgi:acyl-CoA synthetase (NDP forming)